MTTRNGEPASGWKVIPLATEPETVLRGSATQEISVRCASMEVLTGGRIVAAVDQYGPGAKTLPGKKARDPQSGQYSQVCILTSNDQGKTWTTRETFPFSRGCLFRDGHTLYIMGDTGALQIAKSPDGGTTWGRPVELRAPGVASAGQVRAPINTVCMNDDIYLVVMCLLDPGHRGDPASAYAPLLMKATQGANLLNPKSWSYSEPVVPFREWVSADDLDFFGIPFYSVRHAHRGEDVGRGRWAQQPGWYDAHLVWISDPRHYWHDPTGKTLHLLTSAAAHRSNMTALMKFREDEGGNMRLDFETTPAGKKCLFLPLPGGHLKFQVFFDRKTKLYWLASNQVRDSMTQAKRLSKARRGLPAEERQRLQLHFSRNLVDWCFAAYLDAGENAAEARHDGALAVRGEDLYVLVCAGDADARGAHDANLLQFHVIPNFRELVY